MAEIRIKIGASVDRGLENAFRPVEESARRARKTVGSEMNAAAKEQVRAQRDASNNVAKAARDAAKEQAKAARDAARAQTQAARDAAREAAKLDRERVKSASQAERDILRAKAQAEREKRREEERSHRESARSAKESAREQERAFANASRAQAKITQGIAKQQAAERRAFGSAVSTAAGVGRKGASFVGGVLKDVAQGAGAQISLAPHVAEAAKTEKLAVDLSNAGYQPNKAGAAGQRQDPKQLQREIYETSLKTGMSTEAVGTGMQKFVAKTGNLEMARKNIGEIARLSKASGAELDDMADAAADVLNNLGDVPNAGEKMMTVMKTVTAQGKDAAVEVKDLASQMAKLGAASSTFSGDSASVMAQMGAFTQMSRARGGSASATQAATSTLSFANTFSKNARLNQFDRFGVKVRGEDGKVNAKQVVIDALKAAGSAQHGGMGNFDRNMGQMFMDTRARSATRGWEAIFKDAGGGDAGAAAVSKEMDRMTSAMMDEREVRESFTAAMSTSESQANQFNVAMQANAATLTQNLKPAFDALAPMIVSSSKALAEFVGVWSGSKHDKDVQDDAAAEAKTGNGRRTLEWETTRDQSKDLGPDGKPRNPNARRTIDGKVVDETKSGAVDLAGRIQANKGHLADLKRKDDAWGFDIKNPLGSIGAGIVDSVTGNKDARRADMTATEEKIERQTKEQEKTNALLEKILSGKLGVVVTAMPKDAPGPPGIPKGGRTSQTGSQK